MQIRFDHLKEKEKLYDKLINGKCLPHVLSGSMWCECVFTESITSNDGKVELYMNILGPVQQELAELQKAMMQQNNVFSKLHAILPGDVYSGGVPY